MGPSALHARAGLTAQDAQAASIKRAMLGGAARLSGAAKVEKP